MGDAFPMPGPLRSSLSLARRRLGLSGRLFLITVAFVVLSEVLIYLPAVASFRRNWLFDRLAAAQIAALVLDAAPGGHVSDVLARRLLDDVGARSIAIGDGGKGGRLGADARTGEAVELADLRRDRMFGSVPAAWSLLVSARARSLKVIGHGRGDAGQVEILIDQAPLREAMIAFSLRLLLSSIVVAAAAAALVFLVLRQIFVRPVRRLSGNVAAFADDPENAERVIAPSGRGDEIGQAERALARMQILLAGELRHKRRLAGLGLSVSKINHELRNLLTTAQLLGDRLDGVADPVAQRVAPRLVATLDRAIRFCEATLAYGRAAEQHPQRRLGPLGPILAELPDLAGLARNNSVAVDLRASPGLEVDADPEQIARALTNLVRNAVQALDAAAIEGACVTVEAQRQGARGAGTLHMLVADNGPGLPERARTHLFAPFQGSARAGGTGLGLAIAAELVALNGGTLSLEPSAQGTRFLIVIPDRSAAGAD